MPLDVRQRAEAVVLQLEQPIGMVEGVREAHERHRRVEHGPIMSDVIGQAEENWHRAVDGESVRQRWWREADIQPASGN